MAGYYESYLSLYGDNPEEDDSDFLGGIKSGYEGLKSTYYGAKSLITGNELDRQRAIQIADRAPKGESFVKAYEEGNAGKALDAAQFAAGSGLVSLGTMLAGGGVGGAVAKGLVKGATKKAISRGVTAGVMGSAAPQNIGEAAKEIDDDGAAMVAGSINTALDAIPVMGILKRSGIGKEVAEEVSERVINRFGKGILKTAPAEGVTEALQTFTIDATKSVIGESEELMSDENIKKWIDSGVSGAVAGGMIGGAMGAVSGGGSVTQAPNPESSSYGAALEATTIDPNYTDPSQVQVGPQQENINLFQEQGTGVVEPGVAVVEPMGQPMQATNVRQSTINDQGNDRPLSDVISELTLKEPKEAMKLADDLARGKTIEEKRSLFEAAAAEVPLSGGLDQGVSVPGEFGNSGGPIIQETSSDAHVPSEVIGLGDTVNMDPVINNNGGTSVVPAQPDSFPEVSDQNISPSNNASLDSSYSEALNVTRNNDTQIKRENLAQKAPLFSNKTLKKMEADGVDPAQVNGVIRNGKLEVNSDRIKSERDLDALIKHESNHLGMSGMLGGKLNATLDKVSKSKDHAVKSALRDSAGQYKDQLQGMKDVDARRLIASEAIAKMAERGVNTGLMKGVINRTQRALKDMSGINYSEQDVNSLIADSAGFAEKNKLIKGVELSGGQQYSMINNEQSELDELLTGGKFEVQPKKKTATTLRKKLSNLREWGGYQSKKQHQGIMDEFSPFKSVLGDKDALMMAHLTKSADGAIEGIIKHGTPVMKEHTITANLEEDSMSQMVDEIGGIENASEALKWVAGHRADRLKAQDKERLFSQKEIDSLKKSNEGTLTDGRDKKEAFEVFRKKFERMGERVNQLAVDTDLMSPETAEQYANEGFYVPFYRRFDEKKTGPFSGNSLEGQQPFNKLKGANIPLDDLMTNSLSNWGHLIQSGLKNQTALKAIDSAIDMGIAKKTRDKGDVMVRRRGVEEHYVFSKERDAQLVLGALTVERPEILNNPIIKGLGELKNITSLGITASVGYKMANIVRDTITSAAVGKHNKSMAPNVVRGWKHTKPGSQSEVDGMMGGATFSTTGWRKNIDDPREIYRLIDKSLVSRKGSIPVKSWNVVKKVWDKYDRFGGRLENINRISERQKVIDDGGSLLEANWRARDQTDFTRVGLYPATKAIMKTALFLNPRLQGLSKITRAAKDADTKKQFMVVAGAYIAADALRYAYMHDDEDYQGRQDYDRDANHLFKIPGVDAMFAVPRSFELGTITTTVERTLDYLFNDDVNGDMYRKRLTHAAMETLNLSPNPHGTKLIKQTFLTNKDDFSGYNIESFADENKSKIKRTGLYTSSTSKGIATALDKVSGGNTPLSPKQVDHIIEGVFGWAGRKAKEAIDAAFMDKVMDKPEKATRGPLDVPVLKEFTGRFVKPIKGRSQKYGGRFYDTFREINLISSDTRDASDAEIRETLKENEGAVIATTNKNGEVKYKHKLSPDAYRMKSVMSKKKKENVNIQESDATPDVKREHQDKTTQWKNRVTKAWDNYQRPMMTFYDNYQDSSGKVRVKANRIMKQLDSLQAKSDAITKERGITPEQKLDRKLPLWAQMKTIAIKSNKALF